jgi:hypothetical protein
MYCLCVYAALVPLRCNNTVVIVPVVIIFVAATTLALLNLAHKPGPVLPCAAIPSTLEVPCHVLYLLCPIPQDNIMGSLPERTGPGQRYDAPCHYLIGTVILDRAV